MEATSQDKEQRKRKNIGSGGIAFITILFINVVVIGGFGVDRYSRQNPEFCSICHNMQSHVETYTSSNMLDNIHFQAGVGCKDCHSNYTLLDEMTSMWRYVTGDYENVMAKRKFDDAMCTACHISMDYLAANTDYLVRNPHQSHWPDVRCGACHLSHDRQVDYCSRCHDNGGQRLTGDPIVPRVENPWASTAQEEN